MRKPVVAFATNNSAWKNKSIWTADHFRDYVLHVIAVGGTQAPDAASVSHKGEHLAVRRARTIANNGTMLTDCLRKLELDAFNCNLLMNGLAPEVAVLVAE